MNLKTSSNVSPSILNGRSINHSKGKQKSITRASGQQSTNKIHQRMIAMNVFKVKCFSLPGAKTLPFALCAYIGDKPIPIAATYSQLYTG